MPLQLLGDSPHKGGVDDAPPDGKVVTVAHPFTNVNPDITSSHNLAHTLWIPAIKNFMEPSLLDEVGQIAALSAFLWLTFSAVVADATH